MQLIKCSVLSYTTARLTSCCGRGVLAHLLQNCPAEHPSGSSIYLMSLGMDVLSEKLQVAKSSSNKRAAEHPFCSHYFARCSWTSFFPLQTWSSSTSPRCPDPSLVFSSILQLSCLVNKQLGNNNPGTCFIHFTFQTNIF